MVVRAEIVLDALLAKYQDEGVLNLDDANVLKIAPSREELTAHPAQQFSSSKKTLPCGLPLAGYPFDLICHIAFDRPPLTRRERAENVKKRDVFTKYGGQGRNRARCATR